MTIQHFEDLVTCFFLGVVCVLLSDLFVDTIHENKPVDPPKSEVCRNEFGHRIDCEFFSATRNGDK